MGVFNPNVIESIGIGPITIGKTAFIRNDSEIIHLVGIL